MLERAKGKRMGLRDGGAWFAVMIGAQEGNAEIFIKVMST